MWKITDTFFFFWEIYILYTQSRIDNNMAIDYYRDKHLITILLISSLK